MSDTRVMVAEAAMVAELAAARRAECAATARTLRLAAGLVSDRARSSEEDLAEFAALEIGVALGMSTAAARVFAHRGQQLRDDFPALGRALAVGDLDWSRTRAVLERLGHLEDPEIRARVEQAVLDRVVGRCFTVGAVGQACDRVLAAVDPALLRERARRAVEDRHVRVSGEADGMASLCGLLPAVQARTLDARLDGMAGQPCALDPRTVAQRRADALAALSVGVQRLVCECDRDDCPGRVRVMDLSATPKLVVHVVVAAETLAGAADLPGALRRLGVVDPDTVRRLAADATWAQLLTLKGTPVALSRASAGGLVPTLRVADPAADPSLLRYAPADRVAELVRDRDGHCRFPGCTTPADACDLDHVVPFNHDDPRAGGWTHTGNMACLCRHHHRAKTAGTWAVTMTADGNQTWRGPSGQTARSAPDGMPPRPGEHGPPAEAGDRPDTQPIGRTRTRGALTDGLDHALVTHTELRDRAATHARPEPERKPPPDDDPPPF